MYLVYDIDIMTDCHVYYLIDRFDQPNVLEHHCDIIATNFIFKVKYVSNKA